MKENSEVDTECIDDYYEIASICENENRKRQNREIRRYSKQNTSQRCLSHRTCKYSIFHEYHCLNKI